MSFTLSMTFFAFEVFCLVISESDTKDIQWSIGAVYRKRTHVPDSMAYCHRASTTAEIRREMYISGG